MKRLALGLVLLAGSSHAAAIRGGYRGGIPATRIGAPSVSISPRLQPGAPGLPVLTPTIHPAAAPGLAVPAPAISPAAAAGLTPSPAAQPGAFETLAELAGPGGRGEAGKASPVTPGQVFDGSGPKAPSEEGSPVAESAGYGVRRVVPALRRVKRKPAANDSKTLDAEDRIDELGLMYAGTSARSLLDSHIWGDVKLIKPTEGSRWWWNKFKTGETIRIRAGSEWLFYTQLTDAQTKPIGKLTKEDLAGIFTAADIARNPVSELRKAVVERLTKAHKGQFEVTLRTPVRLVHFKTPRQLAAEAGQGAPGPEIYDPYAPRKPLKLPESSPLRRLNQYFPKAVMVDLDLFGEKIPPELIEDMGKLQRAGVKFIFFSNTTGRSYKAQQAQILGGLYGSIFALDGGALITAHSREAAHTRTAGLLTEYDRQVLLAEARLAAFEQGAAAGVSEVLTPDAEGRKTAARAYFHGEFPASLDAERFKSDLEARLSINGIPGTVILEPEFKGLRRFRVQHRHIETSMPDILRALQQMGVYANPQEILVISGRRYGDALEQAVGRLVAQDAPGAELRPGAIKQAVDAAQLAGVPLEGEELVENALGAVLGEYRQNKKGDFVTSASALDSFAHYTDRYFSQELLKGEENVYAFWGHETHDVMNWVAWVHRNTGRVPTEEEAVARHRRQWDEAIHSPELAVYLPPGRDFVDLREAAIGRLRGIYQVYRRIMSIPGAHFIGTEVPNVFALNSYDRKAGETRRVFIRTIFDFAALIPSKDGKGMELWVMDFKSGVKPTQEILMRKIQPRTYRLFTSYKWDKLPREYDIAGDDLTPVAGTELEFIYNRSSIYVPLNGWDDRRTELEILRLAEKMRQDKQRTHIRTKRKKAPAKKK